MIKDAISRKFHFNIIHIPSANKIDFFLLQDNDYAKGEFKRRRAENFDKARKAFFRKAYRGYNGDFKDIS